MLGTRQTQFEGELLLEKCYLDLNIFTLFSNRYDNSDDWMISRQINLERHHPIGGESLRRADVSPMLAHRCARGGIARLF